MAINTITKRGWNRVVQGFSLALLLCFFLHSIVMWHGMVVPVPCEPDGLDTPWRLSQQTAKKSFDSTSATVMAMAQGYDKKAHRRFVGSLRKSGFQGTIILATEPPEKMKRNVHKYLISMNVTVLPLTYVPCDNPVFEDHEINPESAKHKEGNTCIHPYPDLRIRWGRYPFLRDALLACDQCTSPVLISDARDTFFQRDPFGDGAPTIRGLHLYAEHHTIDATDWFVSKRVKACHNGYKLDGPMLCSGTTIADRQSMLRYLDIMYQEMKYWSVTPACLEIKSHGGDQAIMNYLYHSGAFAGLNPQIHRPRDGIVNTVGVWGYKIAVDYYQQRKKDPTKTRFLGADNKTWIGTSFDLTDEHGYFIDLDGKRSRVVHQYDRFGLQLENWVNKNLIYKDYKF